MVEGDYLNKDQRGIVINKAFADIIGWDRFTGKTLSNDTQYRILGVIKDIRFNSLSAATKPMAISMIDKSAMNYLLIKVNTGDIMNTIGYITKACENIEPSFPVEYGFLNDKYNQMLESEIKLKKLVGIFSVFAIVVLCLGLLGTVMFLIEQKTKEIGIRKCLGENVMSIIGQLTRPFLISGMIAGIIAIPIAWYVMRRWLQNYAEHINLNLLTFILSGVIIIGIALLTVFWQSWKASKRNPVESLRYE